MSVAGRRAPAGAGPLAPPRLRVMIFRPNLADGGADRVTVTLLQHLNQDRFDPTLVLMRAEGPMMGQLPSAVRVIALGSQRLRSAWLALARLLRAERPDVLLSTSSGGNLVASFAQLLSGHACRLVLSERNTYSVARKERYPRLLPIGSIKRWLYRRAALVTAVSRGVAEDLRVSLRLPSRLLRVIYNPVVDETVEARAAEPLAHPWFNGATPVLLAAGRLVPQKDYPTLLSAFARVRKRQPVKLVILGEGPERPSIEAMVRDLHLEEDVELPGYVLNPFPYMKRCTVFVLSSKFEGLPGALIQAMACGASVVSTDCPSGPAEIIEPGRSGLLVPVGDIDGLARAIGALLADPRLRAAMGDAARRRAHAFDARVMVDQYETALAGEVPSWR